MYKTGIETKGTVVSCAKRLFYEHGYRSVTVHEICKLANVKLGTFTYYFSRKNDLLSELYNAYMQSCKDYVDAQGIEGLSSAEHHMFVVMLYYSRLYSDERTVAFHREVLNLGSMSAYFENPRAVIADFSDEGSVDRNDPAYNLLVLADNAVRRELNMNFIEQDDHGIDAVEQLLNDIYSITARLFGTDQAKLETYIAHARAFVEAHPDARVSLLEG